MCNVQYLQFFQHTKEKRWNIVLIQLGNCIVMSFVPVFLLAFLNYIIYAGIKRYGDMRHVNQYRVWHNASLPHQTPRAPQLDLLAAPAGHDHVGAAERHRARVLHLPLHQDRDPHLRGLPGTSTQYQYLVPAPSTRYQHPVAVAGAVPGRCAQWLTAAFSDWCIFIVPSLRWEIK